MRILINNEFGEETVLTKKKVTISRDNTLEFNINEDRCNVIVPSSEIELVKQNLLQKGYLDARKYKTVFIEL